jgi:KDO2-lipid IV(A) lauroyltransferase
MGWVILFFLKIFAWLLYLLPDRLRVALGNSLGAILRGVGFREKVVRQNLLYAFPEGKGDEKTREQVFVGAYRHLGNLILEVFFLFGPLPRFARNKIVIEGREHLRSAIAAGNGSILLSSHVGNWEIMAASGGAQLPELNLMLVTKHLKPEWLHQAVLRGRKRARVLGTYEPRTMRDVLSHLKNNGTIGFVLDQYAGPPVGTRVPVFGIPVGTPTVVAAVAKRTGAPVLPCVSYRLPNGQHRARILPPLEWKSAPGKDGAYELGLNTAHYAALLEKDIYEHPDQWLWTHRRFKGDLTPLRENEWSEGRARH